MAQITLKGNPIHTSGELPQIGAKAPDFALVNADLETASLSNFAGKRLLLLIVPSLDTSVCSTMTKHFNDSLKGYKDLTTLLISSDLPFAQKRFCGTEGVDLVYPLSMMRNQDFGKDYGVLITDGPLAGICARAVLILDKEHKVTYRELVEEIAQEPNYEAVLAHLTALRDSG